ncbi:tight adherence pilus pseudopilin TadF [[Haemophilus] ducreyi]|uniref:tight adherence pilus pseudopilin TadF n=1 Tax=Haemophilus ducreyi TaxID=730 RepID=UPI000655AB3B|nr:tight adherence pilus pseudopilin TadF [[Haemophilus] ducreyi]AKO45534.1 tight adherence protein F [[Haemophilus] ducreyi]AKO46920.1 tight adherence protein F [[Haemophilus] ducreyi]AKO48261.1 tight adherence protein F [[Haemophilus] ducreyi]AKO49651.1 tight adherence protein F [[Haemophilus] ducreyi]ANF62565.1 tight adherence protein F [[Haemophilus] ducreyi]
MKKINKKFLKNNQGAVLIEFVFIFFMYSVILIFLIDVAILQASVGKLQRTSYSLTNVIKERNIGHNGNEDITDDELKSMKTLAADLMGEKEEQIAVTIYKYAFESIDSSKPEKNKNEQSRPKIKLDSSKEKAYSSDKQHCQSIQGDITKAAPLTENLRGSNRYATLYQVTVCKKMDNLFKGLTLNRKDYSSSWLRASSLGVAR